jgi:hypothetical protein
VKPTKMQKQKLGINANLVYTEDVSFESSNLIFHIKNKHSVASSRRDHRHESAFITGAAAALASHSAESTVLRTDAPVQSSSQQQGNTISNMGIRKFAVITVSGKEKTWAEQRYRMMTWWLLTAEPWSLSLSSNAPSFGT